MAGLQRLQQLWLGFMLILTMAVILVAWPGITLFNGLFILAVMALLAWAAWTWPAMQISIAVMVGLAVLIILTSTASTLGEIIIVIMGLGLVATLIAALMIEYGNQTLTPLHITVLGWVVVVSGLLTSVSHWSAKPDSDFYYANLPLTSPDDVLLLAVVVMVFQYLLFLRTHTRGHGDWLRLLPATFLGLYLVWFRITRDSGQADLPAGTLEHGLLLVHVPAMIIAFALLMNAGSIAFWYLVSGAAWFNRKQNRDVLETRQDWLSDYIYRLMAPAVILLGVGLLAGLFWSNLAWGHYWFWEAKQVMSMAVWLYILAGLHLRLQKGLQRQAFAWWCVAGALLVVAVWFGTNLDPQGLHSFESV